MSEIKRRNLDLINLQNVFHIAIGKRVKKAMDMGALTRADLEPCARNILNTILKFD